MTAALLPLQASEGLRGPSALRGGTPRGDRDGGFASLLDTLAGPREEPETERLTVAVLPDADLVPRARLGIWPTQPARFSPPKRGSATTSSAPAGPDDGPSGQPLTIANDPMSQERSAEPVRLGARPGNADPGPLPLPPALVALELDNGPEDAEPTLDPLTQGETAPAFRRRTQATADPMRATAAMDPSRVTFDDLPPVDALDVTEAMDQYAEAEAAEVPFEWDGLVSELTLDGVRVEVDAELSVEVRAEQGEVDVHVEGTIEALEELGDLELDLEQALADGERALGTYSWSERQDEPAPAQAGQDLADRSDEPAIEQLRSIGGSLFNGIA